MVGRGASYSLTGIGEKSKRTEISEKKLDRLKKELANSGSAHWVDKFIETGEW